MSRDAQVHSDSDDRRSVRDVRGTYQLTGLLLLL